MFASKTLVALFVAAVATARVVPRTETPSDWWSGLENYQTYHTRYLALGCQFQHGQTFFDECCHPLLKNQSLSSRPSECTPSASASVSAASAEPTSTVTTPNDPPQSSTTGTVNVSGGSDDGDDDDCDSNDDNDDDEDCDDDGDDDDESATPTPTPASSSSSSTHVPSSTSSKASSTTHTSTHTSTHSSSVQPTSSKTSRAPSSTGSSQVFTDGFATFFYQGGNEGACGILHSDSDLIAAIDIARYGDTSVVSPLCGKQVKITNTDNNKSVTVTIADACPGCKNSDSIDLSTGAFDKIAAESTGEVPISWEFI
ncbi:hypothetical protein M0805_008884 [Coniferiporia weirii]|nr:hypothetical protein M0805_008884 [Coniferiporia weirii]